MNIRALFIEDEGWGVTPYFPELEKHGFECRLVRNGNEAFRELNGKTYDLVVMDMMFEPGHSLGENVSFNEAGLKLLQKIRNGEIPKCSPDIIVVVLTAIFNSKTEKQIKALGVKAYLKKPMEFSKVIDSFIQAVQQVRD